MINYIWNCRTVDVKPKDGELTDIVYNVHYIVTGSLGEITSSNIGTQVLDTSNITNFIPFEQLTNDEIVNWTKATIGEDQVKNIENSIAKQIEEIQNPSSVTMTIAN